MKGLIIMNAYPNGEKFYRQSRRLAEELKRAGAETEIRLNGGIEATIRTDGAADLFFPQACLPHVEIPPSIPQDLFFATVSIADSQLSIINIFLFRFFPLIMTTN